MSITIYALVLTGIVLSILISWKFNVNLGIIGLAFAYIIGCFIMKMKVSELIALTPLKILFQLVTITLFFAFPSQNGTLEMIANHILYRFRKRAWSFPLILCMMGSPPPMTGTIIAILGFPIAKKTRIHPLLVSVAAVFSGCGANIPYAVSGAIIHGTIASVGYAENAAAYAWKYFFCSVVIFTLVLLIYFFVLNGHRTGAVEMDKPPSATRVQKINIIVILSVVGLVIMPNLLSVVWDNPAVTFIKSYFDIQMLSVLGALLCVFLKLGEEKKAIAGVPWNTVVMLGGISILLGVSEAAGVSDWLGSLVNANVPGSLIGPVLSLLGGILSFFAGGITVVFPMLSTMVPSLEAASGLSASMLLCSMAGGANITTVSPFSAGGAIVLAQYPDEQRHKSLFTGQLITAFVGMFITMLMSYIGFYNILIS